MGFCIRYSPLPLLVSFKILTQVLHILRELTIKLQMQVNDVVYVYKLVCSVVSTLQGMREDSVGEFKKIFAETTKLGQQLHGDHFELSRPRIVGRQMHRSNPEISDPEDFQITLHHEFLSHIVSELQSRFVDNSAHDIILGLLYFLPSECINEDGLPKDIAQAVELYKNDLPHSVMSTEYTAWIRKWKQISHTLLTSWWILCMLVVIYSFQICMSFFE